MRKALFLLFVAGLLFLGLANLVGAYPRTVVVENFTNWG
jgi:Mn2+/Fe2+ NRAMP family transporter